MSFWRRACWTATSRPSGPDRQIRKRTQPNTPPGRYTVPIWQYPSAAHMLAEQMLELTLIEALALMLAEPVNWQNTDGRISSIVPAEVIASTGESVETFIASLEVLHELGSLTWDNTRRVHIQTFPDDDPVGT